MTKISDERLARIAEHDFATDDIYAGWPRGVIADETKTMAVELQTLRARTSGSAEPSDVSDERIAEILSRLDGLPKGPWSAEDNEADLVDGNGRWISIDHGSAFWKYVSKFDPDTVRCLLREIQELRRLAMGEETSLKISDARLRDIDFFSECSPMETSALAEELLHLRKNLSLIAVLAEGNSLSHIEKIAKKALR